MHLQRGRHRSMENICFMRVHLKNTGGQLPCLREVGGIRT